MVSIVIMLSFLIFKLTRPAVLMVDFKEPFTEKSVTEILNGYEVRMISSNPAFGPVFVSTEVRTDVWGALLLLNKLRKDVSYKEGKIEFNVVDLAMKGDKPVYRFYDKYADSLLERIVYALIR